MKMTREEKLALSREALTATYSISAALLFGPESGADKHDLDDAWDTIVTLYEAARDEVAG